jgi:hypothetical protein
MDDITSDISEAESNLTEDATDLSDNITDNTANDNGIVESTSDITE